MFRYKVIFMVNFIVYIQYFSPVTISKAAYQMLACH